MIAVIQALTDYTVNVGYEYPEYSATATYNCGDTVRLGYRNYRSVADGHSGKDPTKNEGYWIIWDVANHYKALDLQANTATVCNADTSTGSAPYDMQISYTVPADAEGMILSGVRGSEIRITQKDANGDPLGSGTTYIYVVHNGDQVVHNGDPVVVSTIDYSPAVYSGVSCYVALLEGAATVEITITEKDGESALGSLIVGPQIDLGCTLYAPKLNYTADITHKRDPSGVTEIKAHENIERMEIDTLVNTADVIALKTVTRNYYGQVMGFAADIRDNSILDNLVTVGHLDDMIVVISGPNGSTVSYTIREVI